MRCETFEYHGYKYWDFPESEKSNPESNEFTKAFYFIERGSNKSLSDFNQSNYRLIKIVCKK
jgi:hypothetical protein